MNPLTVDFGSIVTQIKTECIIALPKNTNPAEDDKHSSYSAIWDTGAQMSSISHRVVEELGLVPIGAIPVESVHGKKSANLYMINITPPIGIRFYSIFVTEAPHMQTADVLIGMDIIKYGDFLITNGNNHTMMRFQVPPHEE